MSSSQFCLRWHRPRNYRTVLNVLTLAFFWNWPRLCWSAIIPVSASLLLPLTCSTCHLSTGIPHFIAFLGFADSPAFFSFKNEGLWQHCVQQVLLVRLFQQHLLCSVFVSYFGHFQNTFFFSSLLCLIQRSVICDLFKRSQLAKVADDG